MKEQKEMKESKKGGQEEKESLEKKDEKQSASSMKFRKLQTSEIWINNEGERESVALKGTREEQEQRDGEVWKADRQNSSEGNTPTLHLL